MSCSSTSTGSEDVLKTIGTFYQLYLDSFPYDFRNSTFEDSEDIRALSCLVATHFGFEFACDDLD